MEIKRGTAISQGVLFMPGIRKTFISLSSITEADR
jgi:hypothetical protein